MIIWGGGRGGMSWRGTSHADGNPGARKLVEGMPTTLEEVGFDLRMEEPCAAVPPAEMGLLNKKRR